MLATAAGADSRSSVDFSFVYEPAVLHPCTRTSHNERHINPWPAQALSLCVCVCVCVHAGREVFAYKGSVLRSGVEDLLGVVGDAIKSPRLVDYAVKEAAEALAPLAAELRAEPKVALLENLHAAGFGGSSALGHSVYASPEDLEAGAITAETLTHFLGARFTGRNIVVTASSALRQQSCTCCRPAL